MYSYANSNGEAMLRIAEMYLRRPGISVLDMTFGKGRFWTELVDWDIDLVALDIASMDGINVRADFRRLPFPDQAFDAAVFDPPYYGHGKQYRTETLKNPKQNAWFNAAVLGEPVRNIYMKGLLEACRVVRNGGPIIVKCTNGCDYPDMPSWIRGLRIGKSLDEVVLINPAVRKFVPSPGKQKKLRTAHSIFLVIQSAYFGRS